MLRKKGIKGNSTDGPIIEHPRFSRTAPQPEPELELEPMDIHEMAAEHDEQPEEEEEYEETITLKAIDFCALQDTLEDIRF